MKVICSLLAAVLLTACAAPKQRVHYSSDLFRQPKPPTPEESAAAEAKQKERAEQAYQKAYEAAREEALRGDNTNTGKRFGPARAALESDYSKMSQPGWKLNVER